MFAPALVVHAAEVFARIPGENVSAVAQSAFASNGLENGDCGGPEFPGYLQSFPVGAAEILGLEWAGAPFGVLAC